MITFLEGRLVAAGPGSAVLSVGGVGFLAVIPLSTRARLPDLGQACRLETRLLWRDDGPSLFGFGSKAEAELFDLLLRVKGVGPKTALAVLSGSAPEVVLEAIALQDVDALRQLPGVGRKTAERMVLELKDKVTVGVGAPPQIGPAAEVPEGRVAQAVRALMALGYSRAEAVLALETVARKVPEDAGLDELIRQALRFLASR